MFMKFSGQLLMFKVQILEKFGVQLIFNMKRSDHKFTLFSIELI